MLAGSYSVTVARPAGLVFEHIADGTRNPTWRGPITEMVVVSGEGGAGSVWRQVTRGAGGRLLELEYRVTVCEPPHRFAFVLVSGPMKGSGEYTLSEPAAGETVVTLELSLTPRGLMPGLTGLTRRQMATELDSLDRLRELFSAPAP